MFLPDNLNDNTVAPLADIIKNASYEWLGQRYYLPKNAKYEGNMDDSIHGLVKSSIFQIDKKENNSISLSYKLTHRGYPSTISIKVIYTVNVNSLSTEYKIKNLGKIDTPIMCGAHPYFLHNGSWKIITGDNTSHISRFEQGIPIFEEYKVGYFSNNHNRIYDDTYYSYGDIKFITGNTEIVLKRINMPFFEIYNGIFAGENSVAIEPLTGIPNNFNHKCKIDILPPCVEKNFSFIIYINDEDRNVISV